MVTDADTLDIAFPEAAAPPAPPSRDGQNGVAPAFRLAS